MSRLPVRIVEKPWGRTALPTPFVNPGATPIGEIWFDPPPELDALLVKYIFTCEKLSVQCHPDSDQTEAAGLGRQGKEECWLVLDSEPGASLAIGFRERVDPDTMRAAALDGSIEDLLVWHPVQSGDFFYIPANTVHAIGPGVTLIEVQQNSDITYRLYDYGRPREIHLDSGVKIALGDVYPAELHRKISGKGSVTLVEGPFFRLDRLDGPPDVATSARYSGRLLVIPLDGPVDVDGETIEPGACALAETVGSVIFPENGHCLVAQPV